MAGKEQENSKSDSDRSMNSESWKTPTLDGRDMARITSDKFEFTVWYLISDNATKELSEVIVVDKENVRMEMLENHLKHLNCKGEITGQILLEESEKAFPMMMNGQHCQNNTRNTSNNDQVTICKYFLEGSCKFGEKCFNSHELGVADKNSETAPEALVSHNNQDNDNNNSNHHVQSKTNVKKKLRKASFPEKALMKKAPMKTATDVINRIQWDKQLNPEHFTVGYLDRFLGVIEKPYASFDWEDVTSLDETVLAIPRHRIQYFKYHDEVVWDKRKRLDCVFGSTGSGKTILDIIQKDNQENNILSEN